MSIEHLTDSERASFMLGEAMRLAMIDTANLPAATRAEIWAAYAAITDQVLTPDDAKFVRVTTRLIDASKQWNEYLAERERIDDRAKPKRKRPYGRNSRTCATHGARD